MKSNKMNNNSNNSKKNKNYSDFIQLSNHNCNLLIFQFFHLP